MPKTTKDSEKDELNKKKTATPTAKTKKTTSTKSSTTAKNKKTDEIKSTTTVGKNKTQKKVEEKNTKSTTKKSTTTSATQNKTSTKTSTKDKKTPTKKAAANTLTTTKKKTSTIAAKKKSTTATKKKTTTTTSSTTRKKITKKLEETIVAEYYDLPYRYNETIIKILYQTPTILFVYWDISDSDREIYIKQYGEDFFNNTRPILKIYNLTKNYSFEVEINDFANSWYINVNDANCKYKVELSRKKINYVENLNSDYIHITSSNDIEFPNDRILLEDLPNKIKFRNVKTNSVSTKEISTLRLVGINKIYNINEFYKNFYKDEITQINANAIINPSSSSWK